MANSQYFSLLNHYVALPGYRPQAIFSPVTADLNRDGHQDLLVFGASYPWGAYTQPTPQAGAVLFGNGLGGFVAAPESTFPTASLLTVHPRKIVVEDFNGDGRPDVFVASHGWDTHPFPGEQNRLYLSQGESWVDATDRLPVLQDFTHTAAAGDIDGDGDVDLFVGNGYAGQNHILSYLLVNDGAGHFAVDRSAIPATGGSVLDFDTAHHFPGATLADLDGDRLPDLIVTADASASYDTLRQSVVLWNQGGRFVESAMTSLPATALLPNQIVLDARPADVNGDGLQDLLVTGTQGQPFYDGWYVQVLVNQGNRQFTDATAQLMAPADAMGGTPGASAGAPWGMWIKPLDFNRDGFTDFTVEYNGPQVNASTPLVWLNDGTGHFSTLKAGDLGAAGELWRIGSNHWTPMAEGPGIVTMQSYDSSGGLIVTGVMPTAPFPLTPDSGLARTGSSAPDRLRGGDGADTLEGQGGIDTAVYFGNRAEFAVGRAASGDVSVQRTVAPADVDTLRQVERLEFRDGNLALDLDGAAGQVARILGAVFGPAAVGNREYAGIGLSLADRGASELDLMQLALQVSGAASNEAVVRLLYENVIGSPPPAADLQHFKGLLDNGSYSQAGLGVMAAGTQYLADRIHLVELVAQGLPYQPVA
jgi:hypothetical protein